MIPQDLLAFRLALSKLETLEPASERRHHTRYVPSGPLAKAKVQLPMEAAVHDADVVDLSPSGVRLAILPGIPCQEGERCQIHVTPNPTTTWTLEGEIRWVTHHPYVTVFGVLFDPEHAAISPV